MEEIMAHAGILAHLPHPTRQELRETQESLEIRGLSCKFGLINKIKNTFLTE